MPDAFANLGCITAPTDAQQVAPWVDETSDGQGWGRFVRGTRRAVAGVSVTIVGWQSADGTVRRRALVSADDAEVDAAALRKLASELLDAADELDQLKQ